MNPTPEQTQQAAPPIRGADLRAGIVATYRDLSKQKPQLFPLGIAELRKHYLANHRLKPIEKANFKKRFANAIRALQKRGYILAENVPNENHPNRLPKKQIYVWK